MKFIVGIDPGAHGAVAIMSPTGRLVKVIDMPVVEMKVGKAMKLRVSPELLAHELSPFRGNADGWVEQVTAMPGQGVSSMFAFGESFGIVKGVMAGCGINIHTATPSKWKKAMELNAGKDGSRAKAIQMWPECAELFKRVKDDGRAEAALIAEFGRREQI